jgi:hypothetical protein
MNKQKDFPLIIKDTKTEVNKPWKTRYYCPICHCKCDRQSRLFIHLLRHEQASIRKRCQTCPICDRLYDRPERLSKHLEQHKKNEQAMM